MTRNESTHAQSCRVCVDLVLMATASASWEDVKFHLDSASHLAHLAWLNAHIASERETAMGLSEMVNRVRIRQATEFGVPLQN